VPIKFTKATSIVSNSNFQIRNQTYLTSTIDSSAIRKTNLTWLFFWNLLLWFVW